MSEQMLYRIDSRNMGGEIGNRVVVMPTRGLAHECNKVRLSDARSDAGCDTELEMGEKEGGEESCCGEEENLLGGCLDGSGDLGGDEGRNGRRGEGGVVEKGELGDAAGEEDGEKREADAV